MREINNILKTRQFNGDIIINPVNISKSHLTQYSKDLFRLYPNARDKYEYLVNGVADTTTLLGRVQLCDDLTEPMIINMFVYDTNYNNFNTTYFDVCLNSFKQLIYTKGLIEDKHRYILPLSEVNIAQIRPSIRRLEKSYLTITFDFVKYDPNYEEVKL